MTTKYNIGTLNEAKLIGQPPTGLGFTLVDTSITLKNCINSIKGAEGTNLQSKYVAIAANAQMSTQNDPLSLTGKCYKGSLYNPIINDDDKPGAGVSLFDIYGIPTGQCTTIDNCLKDDLTGTSTAILNQEKREIDQLIARTNIEKDDVLIRLTAIQLGKDYASAEQVYKNDIETKKLQAQLAELNKKKDALTAHKLSLSARNSEASILLSDKNRLLATVNSNIQQKYTKLEDVNNKINTITQDIYTNNMETKRKENIIQTLKVIIAIVILMGVILIIYFGMDYVESNSPGTFTNFANKLNSSSLFI
jgi:hypothetical protein